MSTHNIAAFGCWNDPRNKNNSRDEPYLNLVLESLKYFQTKYQDLIILGDNYYPEKKKITIDGIEVKKIIYNEEELQVPFDKIKALTTIPNKYLIMGNHDVADFINCEGLKYQLNLKDNLKVEFPYGSDIKIVNDVKYKYIFIDTNLYDSDLSKKFPCFKTTLYNDDPNFDVSTFNNKLFTMQNKFLIKELSDTSVHRFLIFGHEPIFSIKTKIDKIKTGTLDKLAEIIFDNMEKNNVTYICADVHMYQEGKILKDGDIIKDKNVFKKKYITQIVVGTGGAELDNCTDCDNKTYEHVGSPYKYNLIKSDISYGYLNIKLDGSAKLQYEYVKLGSDVKEPIIINQNDTDQFGGGKKYTSYRINYW